MEIHAITLRSYQDMLHQVINNNITTLFCGMSLITIYVIVMIGRCNEIQQRIYLSLMGISVVGQAVLSSYGLCYYMGFFYGPVHPILPFLLLGIGVDDMFVIMQSLETLSEADKSLDISARIAKSIQVSGTTKSWQALIINEDKNNSCHCIESVLDTVFKSFGKLCGKRVKIRAFRVILTYVHINYILLRLRPSFQICYSRVLIYVIYSYSQVCP